MQKIHLSSPHLEKNDLNYGQLDEGNLYQYIAKFEQKISDFYNTSCLCVNSCTSALHLALKVLDIQQGDYVLCPSFTFIASVNPILYQGAIPIFIDSEEQTWNMCPKLLESAILDSQKKPKAIIVVHLYGMPAQMDKIMQIANKYQIPVIEDAAEAMGTTYQGKLVGTFGDIGLVSFNINKIITTLGGGVLLSSNKEYVQKALYLATQAKETNVFHYQHKEIGYNYRMNPLAAVLGIKQMDFLLQRIEKRRAIYQYYKEHLTEDIFEFLDEPENAFSNRWLSCVILKNVTISIDDICKKMQENGIEVRPLWCPMNQQPILKNAIFYSHQIANQLFEKGLCLPSSSFLIEKELEKIVFFLKRIVTTN